MLKSKSPRLVALTVAVLVVSPITGAQAATAETGPEPITFGYFSTDDWPTVRAAMVKANGEEKVTNFLEMVAGKPELIEDIPGLSELPREAAVAELVQPKASSTGPTASSPLGRSGLSLAAHSEAFGPTIVAQSYSTAPVAGSPVSSGRAWTYANRFNNTTCTITGCTTQCYLDFRLTSNPGFTKSNTDYNLLRFGSCIGAVTFNLEIWTSGGRIEQTTQYTSGSSGRIYQEPHSSTYGKTMYFYYDLLISAPAPGNAEWKSRGALCNGSSSTAYCKFS